MRVIELAGPADGAFTATARLVAVSVGADAGLDVDACDELRLAVEEACMVLQRAGSTRLVVGFHVATSVEVTVRPGRPQPLTLNAPARLLMTTLTDAMQVDAIDGSIHLSKHFA